MTDRDERAAAILSECGFYRYRLWRTWSPGPVACFVMLNPSTADASVDDATIRRVRGFAKREGCGGVVVANLFAWRATDPAELKAADDPVGPGNDDALRAAVDEAVRTGGPIVAAWGSNPAARSRSRQVIETIGHPLSCLGLTKAGAPRHPLYVKTDAPLLPFSTPAEAAG